RAGKAGCDFCRLKFLQVKPQENILGKTVDDCCQYPAQIGQQIITALRGIAVRSAWRSVQGARAASQSHS
ncbi:MAG: hypothetical protein ORN49_10535, partial [Rhodobacteraceae bacterium]|nr:hypothetical protein [Paracoccaceae bacterium]